MSGNLRKSLSLLTIFALMPALLLILNAGIRSGLFGSTIKEIYNTDKDASGIFWTDAESSHLN